MLPSKEDMMSRLFNSIDPPPMSKYDDGECVEERCEICDTAFEINGWGELHPTWCGACEQAESERLSARRELKRLMECE